MSIPRCGVIAGPAKIVTPTGTYVTTGDIQLSIQRTTRDMASSLRGRVGKTLLGQKISIKAELVPIPQYALDLITMQPSNIGSSIYGCTDAYIDIHGRDGVKLRFAAGGLRSPGAISFGTKNLYGTFEWGAVVGNDTDIATLATVLAVSSASFTEPQAAGDASLWQTNAGVLVWGTDPSAPFDEVASEDTIDITVKYDLRPRKNSRDGEFDELLKGVSVEVKLKPQEMTVAQLLTKLPVDGPNAAPGLNLATIAEAMQIKTSPQAEGHLVVDLFSAYADMGNLAWGNENNRLGELTLIAVDSYNSGTSALNPLYAFSLFEEA